MALRADLGGEADVVLCFCTANASRHQAKDVLEHAKVVVGRDSNAIPFAANTSSWGATKHPHVLFPSSDTDLWTKCEKNLKTPPSFPIRKKSLSERQHADLEK